MISLVVSAVCYLLFLLFETFALALELTNPAGMSAYRRERRCAFICSRPTLSGLPVERRPRLVPWWVRDPGALVGF